VRPPGDRAWLQAYADALEAGGEHERLAALRTTTFPTTEPAPVPAH
jgi:hypothetical protein